MTKNRWFLRLMVVMVVTVLSVSAANPPAWAGGKGQLAKEIAESVLQRFGRQAVREGSEVLATRIETAAARHGSDVFEAVRRVGPRALPLMEEAGTHGSQAARARPARRTGSHVGGLPTRAMNLVLRHGEGAAGVLVKHAGGIAEPVVEQYGVGPSGLWRRPALKADAVWP